MKIKTTQLPFNEYVINERVATDVLLMSFATFGEMDLLEELSQPKKSKLRRVVQLSRDDNCTVFCAIKTTTDSVKSLSVAVAHKGKLVDIADKALKSSNDDYVACEKLKIYNGRQAKIALLVDSDTTSLKCFEKVASADFAVCLTKDDTSTCTIAGLATKLSLPTIVLSPISSVLISPKTPNRQTFNLSEVKR